MSILSILHGGPACGVRTAETDYRYSSSLVVEAGIPLRRSYFSYRIQSII